MSIDAKIIDGRHLSQLIIRKLRDEVRPTSDKPGLAAILIGEDPSSKLYIKLKAEACDNCTINFHNYYFDIDHKEEDVIKTIQFLNDDPETDGILVQMPLPEKFNADNIIAALDYKKDVDGFHPKNRADMDNCVYKMLPPLPAGIIELVNSTKEVIENKNIVILCNNKILGQPFKCVWGEKNNLQVMTTEDKGWKQAVLEADVLIVSLGIPFFIDKEMVKQDSIIIDVGINKLDNGEVVGDVNIADVIDKVKFISPVPGGVGPMTVAMLIKNTVHLKKLHKSS